MADGNVVDAASVKVSPELSGFRRELRAELSTIDDKFTIDVEVDVDTAKARAQLAAWREKESGETIRKKVEVDHKTLDKAVSAMGTFTRGLTSLSLGAAAAYSLSNALATVGPVLVASAGAALVLPGALAAAGVAAGTLSLGADGIKAAFEGARPAAEALKNSVSEAFRTGMAPAVESVSSLLPQLTQGFKNVAGSISGVANDVLAMAASTANVGRLNVIMSSTSSVVRNLGAALTPIGEALLQISATGASMFADMTAGAGAAAIKFRDWATSAQGIQQIRDWITGGIDALKQIGAVLGDVIGSVRAVVTAFGDAGVSMGSAFGAATNSIRIFLESAQGQEVLRTLAQTLASIGTTVSTVLTTAFQTLGPAVQAALPGIAQLVQQIGGMLVPALQVAGPILTGLFSFLSANMGWIGPLATSIGIVVAGFKAWAIAANIATVASNLLRLGLQAIGKATWIGILITAIIFLVTVIVQNWDTIKVYLAAAWQWISDTAVSIWNGLVSFFTGLWNNVSSFFINAWNNITAGLTAQWNAIVSVATGIWNGLVSFFTGILSRIVSFFVNGWNNVVQAHVMAFNRVRSAVSNGINAVVGFVSSLPGRIRSALGNLGSLLLNAGRAIIDGLLNGIKAAIGKVYSFVSGIAGKIASLKGPLPYDRRLLIPAGEAIMQGLHKGLQDNFRPVMDLVSGMAPRMAGALNGASVTGVQWSGLENGLSDTLTSMTDMVRDTAKAIGREISSMTFTPSVAVAGNTPGAPSPSFAPSSFSLNAPRSSAVKTPPTKRAAGQSGPDYASLLAAITEGVAYGIDGSRFQFDRSGFATLVNTTNKKDNRR